MKRIRIGLITSSSDRKRVSTRIIIPARLPIMLVVLTDFLCSAVFVIGSLPLESVVLSARLLVAVEGFERMLSVDAVKEVTAMSV